MTTQIKSRFGNMKYEHFKINFKGLVIEVKLIDNEATFPNTDSRALIEEFKVKITNKETSIGYLFYNSVMERQISEFLKNNRTKGFQYSNIAEFKRYISRTFSWGGYDDVKNNKELTNKRIWWLLLGILVDLQSYIKFSEYSGSDFDWFCDNFGYDKDSRKAEKIYREMQDMEKKVNSLKLSEEQENYLINEVQQETDKFSKELKKAIEQEIQ